MTSLILLLLKEAAPIIIGEYERWKASHSGQTPTLEELQLSLETNANRVLAEGAEWTATHQEP